MVDVPANLKKNDQENLQARRWEEVLIGIRSDVRVLPGGTVMCWRRIFVPEQARV
jgi:hypothetical protein